jgi:hypothetical protein
MTLTVDSHEPTAPAAVCSLENVFYKLNPKQSLSAHFEPQRASVRAGSPQITAGSGPHASALRLTN